jgi:hypothetical protein
MQQGHAGYYAFPGFDQSGWSAVAPPKFRLCFFTTTAVGKLLTGAFRRENVEVVKVG